MAEIKLARPVHIELLIDEYYGLCTKLTSQGVELRHIYTEDELDSFRPAELGRIVRTLRDLARTPNS